MGSFISREQTDDLERRNSTISAQLTRQRLQMYNLKKEVQSLRDIKLEYETRCANIQKENSKLHGQVLDLNDSLHRIQYTRDAQNNEIKQLRHLTNQNRTVWNRLAQPQVRAEIINEMLQDDVINSNLMDDKFERKYIENVLIFLHQSLDQALNSSVSKKTPEH